MRRGSRSKPDTHAEHLLEAVGQAAGNVVARRASRSSQRMTSSTCASARARAARALPVSSKRGEQARIDLAERAAQQVLAHGLRRRRPSSPGRCARGRLSTSMCGAWPVTSVPGQHDAAAGRLDHAGDEIDGGGLAGAVRADDAEDLGLVDIEAQIGHGLQAAEVLAQTLDGQQAGHVASPGFELSQSGLDGANRARRRRNELDDAARQEGHGGEQDGAEHDLLQVDVAAQQLGQRHHEHRADAARRRGSTCRRSRS